MWRREGSEVCDKRPRRSCVGLLRIITGASNAATFHSWLALYLRRRRRWR